MGSSDINAACWSEKAIFLKEQKTLSWQQVGPHFPSEFIWGEVESNLIKEYLISTSDGFPHAASDKRHET